MSTILLSNTYVQIEHNCTNMVLWTDSKPRKVEYRYIFPDEENLCANFRPSHEVKNCTEKNMLMVPKLNLTNTLSHTRHAARLQKSTYLQLHNFICSFHAVIILYIHTDI